MPDLVHDRAPEQCLTRQLGRDSRGVKLGLEASDEPLEVGSVEQRRSVRSPDRGGAAVRAARGRRGPRTCSSPCPLIRRAAPAIARESPSIPPPDDPAKVPTWLTITCDKGGRESISGQYVQAQADGVHLKVVDEHGKASWVVETGGPAQYSQSCAQPNWCDMPQEATAPAAGAGCVWYRVVDPHSYYIKGPHGTTAAIQVAQ
jgi:hypothetical protein